MSLPHSKNSLIGTQPVRVNAQTKCNETLEVAESKAKTEKIRRHVRNQLLAPIEKSHGLYGHTGIPYKSKLPIYAWVWVS